ncbi:protein Erd1p [Monosporozyma unispora]
MIEIIEFFNCPVPQRLNLLLLGGIWLWYGILLFLNAYKIDIPTVLQIRLPHDMHQPPTTRQIIQNVRWFALKVSRVAVPLHIITLMLFHQYQLDDSANERSTTTHFILHVFPLCQLIILLAFIICQSVIVKYAVKRLPLIEPQPSQLRNVYILLSDSLTSFTRPLIDFLLFTSLLFSGPHTNIDLFLSSLPSLIRIFQCLREYKLVGHKSLLGNTLKYTCNLPILVCTWYSRVYPESLSSSKFKEIQITCLFINSTFSYLWDVKMDWTLPKFITLRHGRHKMIFKEYIYHIAIVTNLILRFWWLWVVLGHYSKYVFFDGELQYLEILRRAQWVIFKLESEYVTRPSPKV